MLSEMSAELPAKFGASFFIIIIQAEGELPLPAARHNSLERESETS
jgi:hypothetical protein